jgi:hypothetical protein
MSVTFLPVPVCSEVRRLQEMMFLSVHGFYEFMVLPVHD